MSEYLGYRYYFPNEGDKQLPESLMMAVIQPEANLRSLIGCLLNS